MTAEGLARLEDELRVLRAEERPAVIRAIAHEGLKLEQFA